MENFTYATVKGSSVDMYFRRQVKHIFCRYKIILLRNDDYSSSFLSQFVTIYHTIILICLDKLSNPYNLFQQHTCVQNCAAGFVTFKVELSNMYRTMEGKHYKNPELAIDAVKNG